MPPSARRPLVRTALACAFLLLSSIAGLARPVSWTSAVTNAPVDAQWTAASLAEGSPPSAPVVIYLSGLSLARVGTVPDETLLAEYAAQGYGVLRIDYVGDTRADLPGLVADLVKLRADLRDGALLAGEAIDLNRVFIVPAGCRLLRNVEFYRSPHRTLALDVIYPAEPHTPVGSVLEFSCDNQNRMSNGSLAFCTDTLLPVAALAGYAAAMADHPVDAPYRGLDPMPESAFRAKAAVRVLRGLSSTRRLPLNGRIVPAGFSRGSGMALLLATTNGQPEWEAGGLAPGVSGGVQGAIVMSGRFTYLDLLPDDPMIPRYIAQWGPRDSAEATWRRHGALDAMDPPLHLPLFLTINPTESPHALHQMTVLRRRLTRSGSPFVFLPEKGQRGHRMPVADDVTSGMLRYLGERLAP